MELSQVGLSQPRSEYMLTVISVRPGGQRVCNTMWSSHHLHGECRRRVAIGKLTHFLQLPGLGYLYSGLTRRKNALTLLFLSILSLAITSFQWFFIGYSLVFSETGGTFLGDGRCVIRLNS